MFVFTHLLPAGKIEKWSVFLIVFQGVPYCRNVPDFFCGKLIGSDFCISVFVFFCVFGVCLGGVVRLGNAARI